MTPITDAVAARHDSYVQMLRTLVDIDSGSLDHTGVGAVTDVVEGWLQADGLEVTREAAGPVDALVGRRRGRGPRILLLAHLDTVFEVGEAGRRPFTVEGGIARGPGVADDKAGVVAAVVVARVLAETGSDADLTLLFTPDEEIGSPGSREVVLAHADVCDVAFVLEAARADGSLVSARKGGADLRVRITGRAAHSGIEPEKGIHAGVQMAHVVLGLQTLNDPADGITVNAGVASAGTRPNIVPAAAEVRADLRAWTTAAFEETLAAAHRVATTPHVEGVEVEVLREFVAPPMEATSIGVALADWACAVAADLGITVGHVSTGGIGDANTVASTGTPVLDGLAPVGGDDHAPTEWLDLSTVVPRLALLATLCDRIGEHLGSGRVR